MSRRRTRRRNGSGRLALLCVAVAGALLAVSLVAPVASFSTGSVDRGPTSDVVADTEGALAINASNAVHTASTCELVTVTNRFDGSLDVTVALRDDSKQYGSLVVDGTDQGNSTTVTLAGGGSQQIDMSVDDDDSYDGETVYYHVTASGTSVEVTANDRSTPIDNSSTANCGLL